MKKLTTILLLWSMFPIITSAQQRYYVNDNATGQKTGQSWIDAFTDLHFALDAAQAGDEIWVAEGFYMPDTATDRNRTFSLPSGARLLGGFAGTEQSADARNPETHTTILSGNIGNPVDSTDNAFTVLYLDHPDENTFVSGFTIEHGYAQSDTSFGNVSPFRAGGGAYILGNDSFAYPVFDRCVFRNNYAGGNGGGVMVRGQQTKGCSPQFKYCKFEKNSCGYNGGAVWFQGGSPVEKGIEFYHCKFENNKATERDGALAGGVYYRKVTGSDTLEFVDCEIIKNGARSVSGFLVTESSVMPRSIEIKNCYISKNYCQATFGLRSSFWTEGVGDYSTMGKVKIINNLFNDQDDSFGNSMIYLNQSSHLFNYYIDGNTFQNNSGTISIGRADSVFVRNNHLISSGEIDAGGKYIFVIDNVISGKRSQIVLLKNEIGGNMIAMNNLIIGTGKSNDYQSYYDLPLLVYPYDLPSQDTFHLINNTVLNTWVNSPEINPFPNSNLKIYAQNNIFLNNYSVETGEKCLPFWHEIDQLEFDHNITDFDCGLLSGLEVACGNHNIVVSDYPFADTAAGDYHLLPCAPGINGGTAQFYNLTGIATDIDGNDRMLGSAPDIGPYEHNALIINGLVSAFNSCSDVPTGGFTIEAAGGCPPYSISWTGPGGSTGSTSGNLQAGAYSVTVSDSRGHFFTQTAVIGAYNPLSVPAPFIVETSGSGVADGAIAITPEGGLPPYTALWNDGTTGFERTQLLAGTYSVTVTDAAGCTTSGSWMVGTVSTTTPDSVAFTIWPNPAQDVLYIRAENIQSVRIHNSAGQNIQVKSFSSARLVTINTTALPGGVYQISVNNGTTESSGRIVITCK